MCNEENEITVTPLYIMLQAHPPGSMLMDTDSNYWIRRARACVTRHRFISLDDQEGVVGKGGYGRTRTRTISIYNFTSV